MIGSFSCRDILPLRIGQYIMSSVASGLSRYSPRLEVVELHTKSLKSASSLSAGSCTCGRKSHLPRSVTTLYLSGLVGLRVLDVRIAAPFARVKSQFRTSCLDKLVIHSFDLNLSGNLMEGWVVPCRRLQLISEHPETALAVECALCKLNDRAPYDDRLKCRLPDVPKRVEHIDYAFSLHTFTFFIHVSDLRKVDFFHFVCRGLTLTYLVPLPSLGYASSASISELLISGRHRPRTLFRVP